MNKPAPAVLLPSVGHQREGRPTEFLIKNARLLDGRGPLTDTDLLIRDGRIAEIGSQLKASSAIDANGRWLLPGLIDAHVHLSSFAMPAPPRGERLYETGVKPYAQAREARNLLSAGITTVRDVGGYADELFHLRRAIAAGMAPGPRLLLSGRIVSATSLGARIFGTMYLTANGPDEMRAAVRQVIADGADLVKVMVTGALTVDRENIHPTQMTPAELGALVDEAHRLGVRVAAHAEGLDGIRLAVDCGVDTLEHGDLLHEEPAIADRMAERGIILVPTLSVFHAVADDPRCCFTTALIDQADRLRESAYRSVATARAAGVRMAMGFDNTPHGDNAIELVRMVDAGLSTLEALQAATTVAAEACGISDIGHITMGAVADVLLVDDDPLVDVGVLTDPTRRWLVIQDGQAVAGTALAPTIPGWTRQEETP